MYYKHCHITFIRYTHKIIYTYTIINIHIHTYIYTHIHTYIHAHTLTLAKVPKFVLRTDITDLSTTSLHSFVAYTNNFIAACK